MRFDIHLRNAVRQRLSVVSSQMATWEEQASPSAELFERLINKIQPFSHTTQVDELVIGGVDGSGEFPIAAYGDSFIYATVSSGTLYSADPTHGLREIPANASSLAEFTWLTTAERQRKASLLESFARLAGYSVENVIRGSDYSELRRTTRIDLSAIRDDLILPPAHDAGNVGLQLRTTAELATALRIMDHAPRGAIVLTDGTMSLPFVQHRRQSLFFEHLRRFCCVQARKKGIVFGALSKSDGLASGTRLEGAAEEKLGVRDPEHWYFRVPDRQVDGWSPVPVDGPRVPPVGSISYLFRLHRTTPIMRLDLDSLCWDQAISLGRNEQRLFQDLDYASHDQRCFGYPYPIKAAQDRASLSQQERMALRKQVVDGAVGAGLKRSLFRDVSMVSGHT